jgi:hypothetical protein
MKHDIGNELKSASPKDMAARDFEYFLDELSANVQVAGGVGDPKRLRRMTLESIYKELHPNDIVIGFKNKRMKDEYQLSRQMRV